MRQDQRHLDLRSVHAHVGVTPSRARAIDCGPSALSRRDARIQLGVRTTIDLPDELHQQVLAVARATRRTLSETIAELIRRGLRTGSLPAISVDPRTGLPAVSVGMVVTSEDARSLEDEE